MSTPGTLELGSFTLTALSTSLVVHDSSITSVSVFSPVPAPGADPQAWGLIPLIRVVSQSTGQLTISYPPPDVNLNFNYFLMQPGMPTGIPVTNPVGYDYWLPEVLPYVPQCSELVAMNAVRNAVIEFCIKSGWYINEQIFDLAALADDYLISTPTGTEMVRVQDAFYDNVMMKPAGQDDLKRLYGFDWRVIAGRPAYYTQMTPFTIRLCPQPLLAETAAISVILHITPTRDSTTCDGTIYERWLEGIACGAKFRLQTLPQQSFSDSQAALANKALFNAAIGEAKIERNRGMTRATLRVRPPKFV